jgi:hypothetical protein
LRHNGAMPRRKLILYTMVAIAVALGGGWLWGASGRFSIAEQARAAEQRADPAEAHARVLGARVSLFESNFGDAARGLEVAKRPLERVRDRHRSRGDEQAANAADKALERIEMARRLAASLDSTANARTAEAVTLIEQLSKAAPSP